MQCINYKEQEVVILSFQKDFAHIIRTMNGKPETATELARKATHLLEEIRTLNRENYFEDDMVIYLNDLAECIELYIAKKLIAVRSLSYIAVSPDSSINHAIAA